MRLETSLRLSKKREGWRICEEGWEGRKGLKKVVEKLDRLLKKEIEEIRGGRRWLTGRKKWWGEELDKEYVRVRGVERRLESKEGEGKWKELRRVGKEFRRVMEKAKREHWVGYLEGLYEEGGYKWIKTDRNFVVDVRPIEVEGGRRVEGDEVKGEVIIRGLGKREELEQEEKGFGRR